MSFYGVLKKEGRDKNVKILFPEGRDRRVKAACRFLKLNRICTPVLLDKGSLGSRLNKSVEMLKNSEVDAVICGAVMKSYSVVKASFNFKRGIVSGAFLVNVRGRDFVIADCAVNVSPNSRELSEIALSCVKTLKLVSDEVPKIAMLSYSTKGSANSTDVRKVRRAAEIVKKKLRKGKVDGEIQLDSAVVPHVAEKKNSKIIKGDANILVFPDLDSGNIGYKLIQRFGGGRVTGPILQNLKKPFNDLSRGCSKKEIIDSARLCILKLKNE